MYRTARIFPRCGQWRASPPAVEPVRPARWKKNARQTIAPNSFATNLKSGAIRVLGGKMPAATFSDRPTTAEKRFTKD